ncbi:hypothetical protein GCM10012280_51010 [Wenjunlia tyrosinilytica]|uniref:DUF2254 domain-containing protein n=1 Tax=Wenjunlia tyrosinilytica TaxID=1544741 RepID=A0A918E117_9ACTN|nr:hypothetical protein GCM10012280_51010 [Wenjunlia tyrosinilytica]
MSPLRERLRDSFWFAPVAGMALAAVFAAVCTGADAAVVTWLQDRGEYQLIRDLANWGHAGKAIISTVSTAMLTFIGVVFSISLVALQMAASQMSPRVVRLYVRSRITKATFSVFLATFVFALLAQTAYEGETDPRRISSVTVFSGLGALVLVLGSLVLFVGYVHSTLRLMRVTFVIDRVTRESFSVLAEHIVQGTTQTPAELPDPVGEIVHTGAAGVLRSVDVARLTRVARRYGTVLRLVPRIGDFIVPGTPVLTAHGGRLPKGHRLGSALNVGVERTFHQDLGFGLRQLSDIALRALSPAVNDPTTAVQALDRIHQFLAALAVRPLGEVDHRDRSGALRLVQPLPGWADLVDLGLTEIRHAGASQPQVTRRLAAALEDLLRITPEGRRGPLLHHRERLESAVARETADEADRVFALVADRQGIG